jgi:hypothetical protein
MVTSAPSNASSNCEGLDTGISRFNFSVPEEREPIWYDVPLRIPDLICGTLADILGDVGQPVQCSHSKFTAVIDGLLPHEKSQVVFTMKFDQDLTSRARLDMSSGFQTRILSRRSQIGESPDDASPVAAMQPAGADGKRRGPGDGFRCKAADLFRQTGALPAPAWLLAPPHAGPCPLASPPLSSAVTMDWESPIYASFTPIPSLAPARPQPKTTYPATASAIEIEFAIWPALFLSRAKRACDR